MFYPTSYVVYNPMEMPVYPNYMLPPDACCYYYMPPELAPVQEYAPVVPYQEYIPPVKGLFYDQQVRSIRCTCFSQHLEGGQLKGRPGDDIEDMPNMLSYLRKTILVEEKKKIDQGNQQ
ncbi:hypothetical protein CEXT_486871 [Caerostris extrusa]|uniref:Uncharacterized protein n=1 Tax=Caerostris extrusa TaxID=172846 RepID=A0AAV4W820_CAEEX|nr:hypothetical protein CEXT_486871 [Caerostris extrusa]